MRQWHAMMADVMARGELRKDRTGVGTRALFGLRCEFDLTTGFPAVTTKRLAFGQVAAELAAFLAGARSLAEFHEHGCYIWDGNGSSDYWKPRATFEGDLGRIYGAQWRQWRSPRLHWQTDQVKDVVEVDQLAQLLKGLAKEPHGRRHLVTAWNPGETDLMCLPPCHAMWQCFASDEAGGAWLDLQFYMRSLDLFLGMPFDIASYALLAHLIGRAVKRTPRKLVMVVGDAHVYLNHLEEAALAKSRAPYHPPLLALSDDCEGPIGFKAEMASLKFYTSHPAIVADLNI